MGDALAKYREAGRLFPQHEIELETDGSPMVNGNMLYQPLATVHLSKEIELKQPDDNDVLAHFQAWVNNYNNYIKESYDKHSKKNTFSSDQEDIIESFITVESN